MTAAGKDTRPAAVLMTPTVFWWESRDVTAAGLLPVGTSAHGIASRVTVRPELLLGAGITSQGRTV
ncbi:hypothetical protein EYF80_019887 [Liparis tanakae]|uniref:Uncharacterized protein n=1 Tax=Liparis tanakae TaxID=230148 RepID=A0A4Z2HVF0_9TELE|nr:hypothetical protein EYF80_019887 [Liparis tanakae]